MISQHFGRLPASLRDPAPRPAAARSSRQNVFPAGQTSPSGVSPRHAAQSISCRSRQQLADHVAQRGQAELHHQIDHRLFAGGQAAGEAPRSISSKSSVSAWAWSSTWKRGSSPASTACARKQRAAKRVDRADPGRVQFADQAEPMIDVLFRGVEQPLACTPCGCGRAFRAPPAR